MTGVPLSSRASVPWPVATRDIVAIDLIRQQTEIVCGHIDIQNTTGSALVGTDFEEAVLACVVSTVHVDRPPVGKSEIIAADESCALGWSDSQFGTPIRLLSTATTSRF